MIMVDNHHAFLYIYNRYMFHHALITAVNTDLYNKFKLINLQSKLYQNTKFNFPFFRIRLCSYVDYFIWHRYK